MVRRFIKSEKGEVEKKSGKFGRPTFLDTLKTLIV